jgi:hypothetical protein
MIELYHNNLSVCAQKVRIVLAEKDVPWTSRYVSLVRGEQLTPEFKKMNPRGLVVLELLPKCDREADGRAGHVKDIIRQLAPQMHRGAFYRIIWTERRVRKNVVQI